MKIETVKLRNGVTVLAKTTKAGSVFPKTFSNRSQARKAAEKAGLNPDDALRQWGRPWFVAVPADFNIDGVKIPVVLPVECVALVQYGKGEPVTCSCPTCSVKNAGMTPEAIRERMDAANR